MRVFNHLIIPTVPNEEVKSPTFKVFPQSITIAQGQTAVFTCETDKVPVKGTHQLKKWLPLTQIINTLEFLFKKPSNMDERRPTARGIDQKCSECRWKEALQIGGVQRYHN